MASIFNLNDSHTFLSRASLSIKLSTRISNIFRTYYTPNKHQALNMVTPFTENKIYLSHVSI